MLTKPHTMAIMSSHRSTWVNGHVVSRSLNFLVLPITRSTWIRTLESCLDVSTSPPGSCFFPFVKLGILSVAPRALYIKPSICHYAITNGNLLKKSDSFVICLSDTLPSHPKDKKLMALAGVISIKYFEVLLCHNLTMSVLLL